MALACCGSRQHHTQTTPGSRDVRSPRLESGTARGVLPGSLAMRLSLRRSDRQPRTCWSGCSPLPPRRPRPLHTSRTASRRAAASTFARAACACHPSTTCAGASTSCTRSTYLARRCVLRVELHVGMPQAFVGMRASTPVCGLRAELSAVYDQRVHGRRIQRRSEPSRLRPVLDHSAPSGGVDTSSPFIRSASAGHEDSSLHGLTKRGILLQKKVGPLRCWRRTTSPVPVPRIAPLLPPAGRGRCPA